MNYWFWLFIILPPVLVFGVKPEANAWLRNGRLITAISLGCYTFLEGALAWQQIRLMWEGPDLCSEILSNNDRIILDICGSIFDIFQNMGLEFYKAYSFISSIIYVGLNEAPWRLHYRRHIAVLEEFKGSFLSNILLVLIAPVLMFGIICVCFFVFRWVTHLSPDSNSTLVPSPGLMNYWLWNFVILLPFLVFSIKPEASSWLRTGRLATAIALGYLLLNAGIAWYHTAGWHAYNACQSHFRDGAVQAHPECEGLIPGGNVGFFLILGWFPVTGFVGGLELLWRIFYRRRVRETDDSFGEWASNILLILSVPVWIYLAVLITGGIYSMMYPFQPSH